jgi:hypothetical protein
MRMVGKPIRMVFQGMRIVGKRIRLVFQRLRIVGKRLRIVFQRMGLVGKRIREVFQRLRMVENVFGWFPSVCGWLENAFGSFQNPYDCLGNSPKLADFFVFSRKTDRKGASLIRLMFKRALELPLKRFGDGSAFRTRKKS